MSSITKPGIVFLSLLLSCPVWSSSAHAQGIWSLNKERQEWDRDKDRGRERDRNTNWERDRSWERERRSEHHKERNRVIIIKKPRWQQYHQPPYRGHTTIIVPRDRFFFGTHIIRRHGHPYHGYGFFYTDDDAFKWLAFTAITLAILDNLNEEQQRMHEAAQVRATTANVGESIVWEEGNASGSVTTTRIGTSTSGRTCREFQQRVTIGGKTEQAYGTACMNPDGSWEIVP